MHFAHGCRWSYTKEESERRKKRKKKKKKSAKHCASIAELKGDAGQLSYLISKGWKRLKSERQEGRERLVFYRHPPRGIGFVEASEPTA
jgi:hypothetical protein